MYVIPSIARDLGFAGAITLSASGKNPDPSLRSG